MYNDKPVTYVQWGVFSGKGITKAVFPVSIEDLDGNVFADCARLEYVSMPGVKQLNYGETQRPYGTRYGNNNFLKCNALKTVIVASGFTANVQQFTNGNGDIAKLDNAVLILYVNGESSALKLDGNQNLWTGKVFYKGNATKCGQWNFDENGEIIHGASEHNYVDGICSNCGKYSEEKTQGVVYNYDSTGNNGKGVYYVGLNTTLNLSVVEILGKYNDGINGEKSVKYIAFQAFKDNTTIKKVVLPASVDSLEGMVFWGCENLEYISMTGISNLDYASPYGGGRNNNFRNCFKLSVVITSNALSSNVGQFGCGAADTGNKKILDFYVYGESGAPSLDYETADANNLCSGKVYYYSETQKAGCWHYDDNGNAELWA